MVKLYTYFNGFKFEFTRRIIKKEKYIYLTVYELYNNIVCLTTRSKSRYTMDIYKTPNKEFISKISKEFNFLRIIKEIYSSKNNITGFIRSKIERTGINRKYLLESDVNTFCIVACELCLPMRLSNKTWKFSHELHHTDNCSTSNCNN